MSGRRIAVIGAGPVGLSTAVCVQERFPGAQVSLIAEEFSPSTTGDCAAGLLIPHAIGSTPDHLIERWVQVSLKRALEILRSPEAGMAGMQLISGYDVPGWGRFMVDMRKGTEQEKKLFGDEYQTVHAFTSVIAYCPKYLPWLLKSFLKHGGQVTQKRINKFEELQESDVIVNCAGIGARDLAADKKVFPVRGQALRLAAPWLKTFCMLNNGESYMFPVPDGTVVVGGTHQVGNWNKHIDVEDREHILKNSYKLMPHLQKAPIVGEWVGLRPGRTEVRLEREDVLTNGKTLKLVHNYGHGGCGVALAWGCAEHATELVSRALGQVSRL